ncbi:S8 family peptidase [Actinomadura sp. 6N118]|uniref:S8 family peptidase n=1 Tax=Actinomadura sp. 6N118 TaxID=3375151 RepID=UPI0037B96A9C
MLTRRTAVVLAGALVALVTPPVAAPAQANPDSYEWGRRLGRDYREAHQITRGEGVKVALLGSGVARDVRTLRGAVEKEKDFVGTPRPKRRYSTLIAGWIAGNDGDLSTGVGMAPGAKILSVRINAESGDPGYEAWERRADWDSLIAKGIRHAVDEDADVIAVLPFSDDPHGQIRGAVAYAHSKNAVVVTPTSDHGTRERYPEGAAGVIGVGALDEKVRRYKKYTAASSRIMVSAPGTEHPALAPGNKPWTFWGYGPPLAWAAAAVALVKAKYPKLTPAQVGEALATSARHPKGKGKYDAEIGFGIVNPAGALKEAQRISKEPVQVAGKPLVADGSYFGGDKPGKVRAAPYNLAWLGGFGSLALLGLILIGVAVRLLLRRESGDAIRS